MLDFHQHFEHLKVFFFVKFSKSQLQIIRLIFDEITQKNHPLRCIYVYIKNSSQKE